MKQTVVVTIILVFLSGAVCCWWLWSRGGQPPAEPAVPLAADPGVRAAHEYPIATRSGYCPVARPAKTPAGLEGVIDELPALDLRKQLERLKALAALGPAARADGTDGRGKTGRDAATPGPDAAMLDALRWLIHQPERHPTLLNEAAKTLAAWEAPFLTEDLSRLWNDGAHSPTWRAWTIQHLASQYAKRQDAAALASIFKALDSEEPTVRDQALYSLAKTAADEDWRRNHPARYDRLELCVSQRLDGADAKGQTTALAAAGQLKSRAVVTQIEGLALQREAPVGVRFAAINALRDIGEPGSIPVLEECAADPNARISETAHTALARMAALGRKED
jgi:hypothetical protein